MLYIKSLPEIAVKTRVSANIKQAFFNVDSCDFPLSVFFSLDFFLVSLHILLILMKYQRFRGPILSV